MKFAYERLPEYPGLVDALEGPPWISKTHSMDPCEGSDVTLALNGTGTRMEIGFDWDEWDTIVERVEALRVGQSANESKFYVDLFDGTQQLMEAGGQLDEIRFPLVYDDEDRLFRRGLLESEYREYLDDGEAENDPVETADGLLDVIVIAWGTLLKYFGPKKAKAMAAEVVRSNLDKINGKHGPIIKREDGKILKPEGWKAPQLAPIIYEAEYSNE